MTVAYSFGSFNLNDGLNYFLLSKDSHSLVSVAETLFKVGRLEGMKKTGAVTNERIINAQVRVLGTSRADLENKLDTMMQALALQQQHLTLHSNDSRYFIADCVDAKAPLGPGNVVTTVATLKFVCQQPYALAASASNFNTSNVTLTLVSGSTYQFSGGISIAGGGNIFSRPTITINAQNALTWTQIQIQQLTDGQYLTLSSNLPTTGTDFITIVCDPYAQNGYKAYKNNNAATLCAVQGLFPVLEPTTTSWQILVTVSGITAPIANANFNWVPRWLS